MNWISNVVPPKIRSLLRRETPENLWVKCPESGQLVYHKDLEANQMVVPGSGYHMSIAPRVRLATLFDGGAYQETQASGAALAGASGSIVGQSLEGSNTDIATEFTKLIVTQQAYSANTKVITTANQMSQDLLNIIR